MSGAPTPAGTFPFAAVVGQDDVKLALLLAAVDAAIAGVLLRGEKGSAKTTLARGLAALLPGDAPFVELPVGATEDRLVGTLDLAAALTGGERRFEPGLLSAAHGGVLYVDEVNLLPDHLVDVLLDVAASGVNRVEREGISHSHPSRFLLIGSMNPEEGDLRPQLLDRFGLAVDVVAPIDPPVRAEAVRRRLAFDADPSRFRAAWAEEEASLATRLAAAVPAGLPESLIEQVSRLCAAMGAQGLRADLTICRAAAALAGLEGRASAGEDDVRRVAMLALGHRRRTGPFDSPGVSQEELDRALGESDEGGDSPSESSDGEGSQGGQGEQVVAPGATSPVVRLVTSRPAVDLPAPAPGRRSTVEGPRGRMVADRPPNGPIKSLAVGATVRAAVARRASPPSPSPSAPTGGADDAASLPRPSPSSSGAAAATAPVAPQDLREAVRQQRAGNLIVLTVDASGSMGAQQRMEAAKGAVLSLLLDAYQRRDKVALVTFGGQGAQVVLKPTSSVEVARARLRELPTGGRTPLAAGIRAALDVAAANHTAQQPLLVFITDGRANWVDSAQRDPIVAAREAANLIRQRGVSAVVIDAENGPTRLGLAKDLAEAMNARYLPISELAAAVAGNRLART